MLFVMPIYFLIVLLIIIKALGKYNGKYTYLLFLWLYFLFNLSVGWDVIAGKLYFKHICEKDGGVHIYQTVELVPECWDEDGRPKFYT